MPWNMLSATCTCDFTFSIDLISHDYPCEKENNMLMCVLKANVIEMFCKVYVIFQF